LKFADQVQATPTTNPMTDIFESSNVQSIKEHVTKQTTNFVTPTAIQSLPDVQSSTQHYTSTVCIDGTPLNHTLVGMLL